MLVKFEPSGTHLKREQLKVRLDLFPDVGDKAYPLHHVYVPVFPPEGYQGKIDAEGSPVDRHDYDEWEAGLPHIWQVNPALCAFISVDANITPVLLSEFITDIYKPDILATIDDCMSKTGEHESAHLISPFMRQNGRQKTTLSSAKTSTLTEQDIALINSRLVGLSFQGLGGGQVQVVRPQSIDVGPGATNRASYATLRLLGTTFTQVDGQNAANATGNLDTGEIWLYSNSGSANIYFGTFSDGGSNVLTCRDSESVGDTPYGSKQTYTGLTISVVTGDYLGTTTKGTPTTVQIEKDNTGNCWYKNAEYIDPSDSATFSLATDRTISIYATGTEAGGVAYTKISNETIQISEGIVKQLNRGLQKVISETVQLSENITRQLNKAWQYVINETVQLSETAVKQLARGIQQVINETIQLGEDTAKVVTAVTGAIIKVVNETLQISEGIQKARSLVKQIDETLQISEASVKRAGLLRIVDEVLQISETAAYYRNLIHSIDETLQISESTQRARGLVRHINETIQISESIGFPRTLVKVINDTIQLVETAVTPLGRGLYYIINETVQILESVVWELGVWKWIYLTLKYRVFGLLLKRRSPALTLKYRTFALNLSDRLPEFVLKNRDFGLTLPKRRLR